MIYDPSTTTTFPNNTVSNTPGWHATLDNYYNFAQYAGWTLYFGVLFSWALFACVLVQVYFYFCHYPNDRRVIKATVLLLLLLEVGATSFLTFNGYVGLIRNFGHNWVWTPGTWGAMLFDCLVASIVHFLYAWRVWKLVARQRLAMALSLVIILLSLTQFSCCVAASTYAAYSKKTHGASMLLARRLFRTWLVTATTADIVITVTMAIKLRTARTGVKSTDRSINKLLYVTVPGGALTAILTFSILIIQIVRSDTNMYTVLILPLAKVYTNSVLLCLNLRSNNINGHGRHTMLTGFQTANQLTTSQMPIEIKVHSETDVYSSSSGYQNHSYPAGLSSSSCDQVSVKEQHGHA